MSLMTETLARIGKYCGVSGSERGIEEVQQQLTFFPFQLSDEAYEFYQWVGAPVGEEFPEDWDAVDNNYSTCACALESLLGNVSDLIHFMSIEEAVKAYSPFSGDVKGFPFVSYENGLLMIVGSEDKAPTSPVLSRENGDRLWFPSLTNMMLAILESLEVVGSIGLSTDYDDEDYGTPRYAEKIREQGQILEAIAKKYGSPRGIILTN
jgi:hypothetical protein